MEGSPITYNLLPLLGVAPIIGRSFLPEEDRPGGPRVALISYRLWQQRYGGDRALVGRDILIDQVKCRVVGIMPPGFQFPQRADIWTPMSLSPQAWAARDSHYLQVFARLRPGVTIADAQGDMSGIAAQLTREYPETNTRLGATVVGLRDQFLGKLDLGLRVLAAGVGCVLLICCANLAGLMLARAAGRGREMAVRAALGAGRWRLVRLGLWEALLVGGGGAVLGLLLASDVTPWLGRLVPASIAGWSQPRIDWRLVAFASLLALAVAAVAGSLPAIAATRVNLASAMQQGGRAGITGAGRLRRALVAGEVALTVVLSVGAGLMIQTVWRLAHVDLGFQPESVLTVRTSLKGPAYSQFTARHSFYERVLANVEAIPGVQSAGYTTFLPLTNRGGTSTLIVEGAPPPPPGQIADANHRSVSADYFRAVGTPLVAGRHFGTQDRPDSAPVAIINEAMARQFWPHENPLGRRFHLDDRDQPWVTVVGIVASARQMGLDLTGRAEMYFPSTQPFGGQGYFTPRDLAIRVKGNPLDFAGSVRQAIWSVDRSEPVADVQPLEALVASELTAQRAQLWLLASYAGVALLLAAIGLYGLLSHFVVQRTRDIGVRMALGARESQVLVGVMRQGMALVAVGLAVGISGAAALARVMQSLLFGVQASDIATYAAVAWVLAVVGALACYVPARRAARIDPMVALRTE